MDIRGDIPDQKFAIKTGPDAGTLDIDKRIIDKTNIDNIFNSEVIKELEEKGTAILGKVLNVFYLNSGAEVKKDDISNTNNK